MNTLPITLTRRARLGAWLHPQEVTRQWYAADCPPEHVTWAIYLTHRERIQWWVSLRLRGLS